MVRLHVLRAGVLQGSFCLGEGPQWLGSGVLADLVLRASLAPSLLCRIDLTPDGRVMARVAGAAEPCDLRLSDGTTADLVTIPNGDFAELAGLRLLVLAEPDPRPDAHNDPTGPLRGPSEAMHRVREKVARLGPTDEPVLVTGEPGTGKGLVARTLARARDGKGPSTGADCSRLPLDVIESLLFGYREGAFEGASRELIGSLEAAGGNTVFLDEIGDLPPELQPRLFNALQEKAICRRGESEPRGVKFRLVATTYRDLDRLVAEGRFHPELHRVLRNDTIELPPLRSHKSDIGDLARAALHALEGPPRGKTLSHGALDKLRRHDWPGNVRELLATVRIAAVASDKSEIPIEAVVLQPPGDPAGRQASSAPWQRRIDNLPAHLEDLERAHCLKTLATAHKSVAEAARELGLEPVELQRRLDRWQPGARRPARRHAQMH
jgi:DNA-binding NtrC family response regulator